MKKVMVRKLLEQEQVCNVLDRTVVFLASQGTCMYLNRMLAKPSCLVHVDRHRILRVYFNYWSRRMQSISKWSLAPSLFVDFYIETQTKFASHQFCTS